MNDCPNADVRDLLPDLVHERLGVGARATVAEHVAGCPDCAAELELLRQFRATRRTPRVDVASIVAAVPPYRAVARRSWVGWRAAAAITILVAGASSVALIQRGTPSSIRVGTQASAAPVSTSVVPGVSATTPTLVAASPEPLPRIAIPNSLPTPANIAEDPAAVPVGRELAMGGGAMGDLDDHELASLLKDIESLDAVPSIDVESTPVSPIGPSAPAGP